MSVRARAARTSPDASRWTSTPASESLPAACARPALSAEPESTPITSAPRSRSASAAATPERARPTTRYGPGGSGGRKPWLLPTDRELVQREADRGERRGDDPETQDDLRLRPGLQLEMVVNRGHQEHPLAERLKREDLDHDRQRLDHEDPAEQDQQHARVGHDRQARDRAA